MPDYSCLNKWSQLPQREPDPKTVCSFCKQVTAEDKLITGPGVKIGSECFELCNEIQVKRRTEYHRKTVEGMALTLCECQRNLPLAHAMNFACKLFDAGYRKEEV